MIKLTAIIVEKIIGNVIVGSVSNYRVIVPEKLEAKTMKY